VSIHYVSSQDRFAEMCKVATKSRKVTNHKTPSVFSPHLLGRIVGEVAGQTDDLAGRQTLCSF